jgi:hypothetical protein
MYLKHWKKIIANLDYSTQQSYQLITEREIKPFSFCHDKQKLKQFMTTQSTLQKMLKGILHIKEEDKCDHENMRKNKFPQMSS